MSFRYDDEIQIRRVCDTCNGTGQVKGHEGSSMMCATCSGDGKTYQWIRLSDLYLYIEDELERQRRHDLPSRF